MPARRKSKMPARNKKNFRSTKSGAGMTKAGVRAYRRLNPGSKLKTAVTWSNEKVPKSSKKSKFKVKTGAKTLEVLIFGTF